MLRMQLWSTLMMASFAIASLDSTAYAGHRHHRHGNRGAAVYSAAPSYSSCGCDGGWSNGGLTYSGTGASMGVGTPVYGGTQYPGGGYNGSSMGWNGTQYNGATYTVGKPPYSNGVQSYNGTQTINGNVNGVTNANLNGQVNGQVNNQLNNQLNGQVNGQLNGQVNGNATGNLNPQGASTSSNVNANATGNITAPLGGTQLNSAGGIGAQSILPGGK